MAFKIDINIMLCPIKVNSNTIELRVHTSCYCVLDLLCVMTNRLSNHSSLGQQRPDLRYATLDLRA